MGKRGPPTHASISVTALLLMIRCGFSASMLTANPEAGDVIRGSGGVRKLRWGLADRGKRVGVRVIYYLRTRQGEVWMLTLYAKTEVASISGYILKKIKEEIDGGA